MALSSEGQSMATLLSLAEPEAVVDVGLAGIEWQAAVGSLSVAAVVVVGQRPENFVLPGRPRQRPGSRCTARSVARLQPA